MLLVALLPALMLVLFFDMTVLAAFLGSPALLFLGDISYAMYLLHLQLFKVKNLVAAHLLRYVAPQIADACALVVFAVVLIGCSWLAYVWIEKPCRKLITRSERFLRPEASVPLPG